MKLSLKLLQDYIDLGDTSPEELVEHITEKVAEVDELEVLGTYLGGVVVGKVTELKQHPDADRLRVCQVLTDKGAKPIVCGGSNLYDGMYVAFAHVGATVLWGGKEEATLEPVKLRGQPSEGMICAAEEIQLEELYHMEGERPVIDLGKLTDEDIGTPLQEFLGLNDSVIHIDNHAITHRSDLFSHIGFARELVAMGIAKWAKEPEFKAPNVMGAESLPVLKVEDDATMPRYMSCVLEIDDIGETPMWMKERLRSCGWRSINLPVDITNFVLLETGLPLHSFDLDDIKGAITMRSAKKGETIVTLDETERKLTEGALILEDEAGIFDLLGIMGGLRSSTTAKTRRIYLHGASLDPVKIRTAMMQMGHRTDAGTVYEKGVQPYTVEQGIYRTIQLMLELIPGAKLVTALEDMGATEAMPTVEVHVPSMLKVLGFTIEHDRIVQILTDLGCQVATAGETLSVTPPLWRRDLVGAHDITEEVARMYGYNSIEPVVPMASIEPPHRDFRMQAVRQSLQRQGYLELLPLSLVGPKLIDACGFDSSKAVTIADPLGEELSMMQPSLLCSMLRHATEVDTTKDHTGKTFTIGHVFPAPESEFNQLCILQRSTKQKLLINEPLLQLLSEVYTMSTEANVPLHVRTSDAKAAYMHPGRSATVELPDGTSVGQLFEVHPNVLANLKLEGRFACLLLNVDVLLQAEQVPSIAGKLHQFPAISYDYTFNWSLQNELAPLLLKAKEQSSLLESVELIDMYSKTMPATEANVTVRFTYRSTEGTLKEAELEPEHTKVLATFPAA